MLNVCSLRYFHNNLNNFQWVSCKLWCWKTVLFFSIFQTKSFQANPYDFIGYLNSWEMLDRPRRMKCFNLLSFNNLHRDTWHYRQYFIEWNVSNEFIIRWNSCCSQSKVFSIGSSRNKIKTDIIFNIPWLLF